LRQVDSKVLQRDYFQHTAKTINSESIKNSPW
jgi:hypothetical protein